MLCPLRDVTRVSLRGRRITTLKGLGSLIGRSEEDALESATKVLSENVNDVPFCALYKISKDQPNRVELSNYTGLEPIYREKLLPEHNRFISLYS